ARMAADTVRRHGNRVIPRLIAGRAPCRGSPATRRIEADTAARRGTVRRSIAAHALAAHHRTVPRRRIAALDRPTLLPRMEGDAPAWAAAPRPIAAHLLMEVGARTVAAEVAVVRIMVVVAGEVAVHRRGVVTAADG